MKIYNLKCYITADHTFTVDIIQNRIDIRTYLTKLQKFSFIRSFIHDHCNCTTVITIDFAIFVISLRDFLVDASMHAQRYAEIVTQSAKLQCIRCKISIQSTKWLYRCNKLIDDNNGYDIYLIYLIDSS